MISNAGYVALGKQVSKGAAIVPSLFVPYLSDGFNPAQNVQDVRDDKDFYTDIIKTGHREAFSFSCFARPDITAYLLAYILGDDTKAGAGDPYTHTIKHKEDGRAWLTIDRKLDANVIQRYSDCKIEGISISGEAGKSLMLTLDGNALTANLITTEISPIYKTRNPFMFYHGSGRFKFDGGVSGDIKSFDLSVKVDSKGGQNSDEILLIDLPDYQFDVELTANYMADDTSKFKKINYNNTNSPSEDIYSASFEFDCQYTENVANDRQFKMEVPKLIMKSLTGINLSPSPASMIEALAGVAVKQNTTEIITATLKNAVSVDIV